MELSDAKSRPVFVTETGLLSRVTAGIWPYRIVIALLVALVVTGSAFADRFGTARNLMNVLEQLATLALAALGQTIVILIGGIDLSIGAVISAASMLTSGLIDGQPERVVPVVVAVLMFGAAIGTLNGYLVERLRVHSLIVTLGMASILQGACLLYSRGPVGSVPREFEALAFGRNFGVPISTMVVVAIYMLAWCLLRYTRTGRQLYAFGGESAHARLLGISGYRVQCVAFGASGLCAAVAGVFLVSRTGIGEPLAGSGFDLASVTPVVVGGTILAGGKGGVIGTFLGVLLVSLLNNVLNFLDVSTYYQWIIQGIIIISAVSKQLDRRRAA